MPYLVIKIKEEFRMGDAGSNGVIFASATVQDAITSVFTRPCWRPLTEKPLYSLTAARKFRDEQRGKEDLVIVETFE